SKGHRVYWPDKRTISIEHDIRFEPDVSTTAVDVPLEGEHLQNDQHPPAESTGQHAPEKTVVPVPEPIVGTDTDQGCDPPPHVQPEPRAQRTRKPSQWIKDLQSGVGTAGGRGAQKLPSSI
ncbi:hypothetical protein POSPLADRAFT_1081431, partial [Postia placenta MAD-698-R-SB12]